ncbi:MAG: hypothetical protein ACUVWV_15855 [Thermodesulfobacteriota bacterium]
MSEAQHVLRLRRANTLLEQMGLRPAAQLRARGAHILHIGKDERQNRGKNWLGRRLARGLYLGILIVDYVSFSGKEWARTVGDFFDRHRDFFFLVLCSMEIFMDTLLEAHARSL